MMNNIEIIINKENRMVDLNKSSIGNDGENLQYNLVFSFLNGFVDGQARLEYQISGEKYFAILEKHEETYTMPINSLLTKVGKILMQVVITQGTSEEEVPIFKSNVFYMFCNSSINAQTQEPDGYVEWLDIANTKLNEIDNINIEATKENGVATITITNKDGSQDIVNLYDGEGAITNYEVLDNKPSINGVELTGDKSLDDLNIQEKGDYLTNETDPVFKQSASYGITSQDIKNWNNKSEFSGNYDDLNGKPTIPTKTSELTNDSDYITGIPSEYITESELEEKGYLTEHQDISGKQDTLVSGENIKTINGNSILGSGNITIESSGGGITEIPIASNTTLGGIKVGANLTIEADGTLNATASSNGGSGADDVPINTIVEYDGEEVPSGWEEVEETGKNIITAYITQTLDIGENEIIPFDSSNIIGSKFTLENGKIKIGSGVSKVKVSGQIWYYAYDTTRQWFYLKQNANMINTNIAMLNKSYGVLNFNEKIIDVVEGDVIYFELIDLEGTGTIGINYGSSIKNMTYITIEEVSNVVNSVIEEDANWVDITLINNWVQGADTYNKPQYKKVGNRIELRGFITNPNELTATTRYAFTMPNSLYPQKINQFNLYASTSNFIGAYMSNSGFRISANYQAGENLSLDGIFYYLD